MMEENIIVTLDNNEKYVVVNSTKLNDYDYVYLGNINNKSDFMICKIEGSELTKIDDTNLIKKVLEKIDIEN